MKVSEITIKEVSDYLRIDEMQEASSELTVILKAAIAFIKSYTALDMEQIDTHEDFSIVVYILCQDMYDNRSMYVDKNHLNRVVETILSMHSINYL